MKYIQWEIFLIFVLALFGCNNPEKLYNRAIKSRSIEDFQRIVEKYPDSEFLRLAVQRIGEIKFWSEIDSSLLEQNYQTYLDRFPDGLFKEECGNFLDLINDYQIARKDDIIASYDSFLVKYPNSLFHDSIRQRLEILEPALIGYQILKEKENIAALKSYVREFKGTGYAQIFKIKIDSLTLSVILERLSSKDGLERANALYDLEKLGDKAKPGIPQLIGLLDDNYAFVIRTRSQDSRYIYEGRKTVTLASEVKSILKKITDQNFGSDKREWQQWWENEGQHIKNNPQDSL